MHRHRSQSLRSTHCTRASGLARTLALALTPAVFAGPALAQEAEDIKEKVQHGEVNWTDRKVMATGSGAPNLELKNVAQVRLNAERAAKLAAYRNVLEAIKGVRVSSGMIGAKRLEDAKVAAQIEGIVRGCKTVDTRYFSDYGVDVVVECPLDGALAGVLVPNQKFEKKEPAGEKKYTGLIIDASGIAAKPALAPRLLDANGSPFYTQATVNPTFRRKHGVAAYQSSVDVAKKSQRVGKAPLVVKAVGIGEGDADLKLSAEDLAQLEGVDTSFLSEGRVIIATGS